MRTRGALAALLFIPALLAAQSADIVPRPARFDPAAADFQAVRTMRIVLLGDDSVLRPAAELFHELLRRETGWDVIVTRTPFRDGDIVFQSVSAPPADSEAYQLRADPGRVTLRAATRRGAIWGAQTLIQRLTRGGPAQPAWRIRGGEIRDAPRYPWRGVLLDAARHFLSTADVKRFIDLMSRYKLNVLHWHLTDDQGWRLEIRRYPLLTSVGAWRIEADGSRYGGFYTQQDVRDVVDYARRRGITVVPEIEMPGHSSAAIAAYPELGCTGDSIAVPTTWGVFDDIYCAGHERTFWFLEQVLNEVVALFPSRYIHIGGDEVPKVRWRDCAECQAVIRREGLRDEEHLQSWFLSHIGRHLERHGRRMIGWDEILDGGLPAGAAVQVWRDTAAIGRALAAGALVVASPTGETYINSSPRELPLSRVYAFDPAAGRAPEQATRILGGEATLWSEFIDAANLDLMAWPRLLAFAEALWSGPGAPYAEFQARLPEQYRRLREAGVRIGPEDRDVMRIGVAYDSLDGSLEVRAEPGTPEVALRYEVGGAEPTAASASIDSVARFTRGPVALRTFAGGLPTLQHRRIEFVEHQGRGRRVTVSAPSRSYPGTGSRTLTDGLLGSDDHHDGLWNGWQGRDVEIVIDLGGVTDVRTVEASVLQSPVSWIILPGGMTVSTSDDGTTWLPGGMMGQAPSAERTVRRIGLTIDLPAGRRARFVKVVLANGGPLPAWHAAAGRPSWIFADEIVVR